MRNRDAKAVALGGMLAALALVIMCLGGLIPVATYVCPVLCMLLLAFVLGLCGKRIAWAWYSAVMLLCLLMAPDKEAASVFVFLGYYPIIKPWMDQRKLSFLWKLVLFNAAIFAMYTLLIHLFGLTNISEDFAELGAVMTAVTLVLGNITLFLFDLNLTLLDKKKRRNHG